MELRYLPHVEIRLVHDKTYQRGGTYKKWSDSKYSSLVHKTVLTSFILSFVLFQGLQTFFPYLNLFQPREVRSATNSVTWTTKADFETATTNENVNFNGDDDSNDVNNNDFVDLYMDPLSSPTGSGVSQQVNGYNNDVRSAIALDDNYRAHIVYTNSTTGYRTNKTGSWVTENIGSGTKGYSPDIAIDSGGNIHVSYTDSNQDLYHATNESGSWVSTIVFDSGGIFSDPVYSSKIALDSNDKITIIFYTGYPDSELRRATNNTGSWVTSILYDTGIANDFDMALAPNNALYVCYYKNDTWDLRVNSSTVASSGDVGRKCSIAVDSSNKYHVTYYDATNDDLRYYDYSTYTNEKIEDTYYGASPSSLHLDNNDKAHIIYLNNNDTDVDYVTNESGSWVNSDVDHTFSTNVPNVDIAMGSYTASKRSNDAYPYVHATIDEATSYFDKVFYYNNAPTPYSSPGTLGGTTAGDVALRADLGTEKAKASTLEWSGATASSGQKLLFKVRAGDTQAELDANQCYGPGTGTEGSGLDDGCADWTTAGKFFSQVNGQSNSSTSIDTALPSKRYVEVLVRLESSGDNTPQLDDVTLYYDTLEAPTQEGLYLRKSDGSTALKTYYGSEVLNGTYGGHAWTNETSARLIAGGLTCSGCGTSTNIRPEVEVTTQADTDFSSPVFSGAASSGDNYVDITGLVDGEDYHMRVRAIDDQGRVSGWTNYAGDYSASDPDFSVEQNTPTGTVSIEGGAEFGQSTAVTLTLTASDAGGSSFGDNEAWLDMRFSNDGSTWSDWEDFAYSKSWDLESGDGVKTVYYQLLDNAGNISGEWRHLEDFSSTSYKDGSTTASWNTSSERVLLPSNFNASSTLTRTISAKQNAWGSYSQPSVGDFDNDGDHDLIVAGEYGLDVFENTGSDSNLVYTYRSDWDITQIIDGTGDDKSRYSRIALGDLDNDGDLDIMQGNMDGDVRGFENVGSASSPDWQLKSAWNIGDLGSNSRPYLGDLDNDGDLDMVVGLYDSSVRGYRNTGTASSPTWSYYSSWNIALTGAYRNSPALTDIDGDGDLDIFIERYNTTNIAKENTGDASSPVWSSSSWNFTTKYGVYFADLTGDGKDDYFSGDTASTLRTYYYTNTSSSNYTSPAIAQSLTLDSTSEIIVKATLSATENLNGQTITYEMTADGTNWESVTNGVEHNFTNTGSDLRWRANLSTGITTVTPEITNIQIDYQAEPVTDTITLDTSPPDAFDLSSPASGTWQNSDSTPDLTWNASSDSNTFKYQLYVGGALDADNIDSGTTTIAPTTPFTEANHTWYVKAVDSAGNETQSTSTYNIGYDASAPSMALDPGFTFAASDSNSDNITLTWNTYSDDSGNGSPASTYTVERLRHSIYTGNSHTLTSDWASEDPANYYNHGVTTSGHTDSVGENPEDIEQAVKYIYRIKVTDQATNESAWLLSNTGLTSDGIDPTEPTDVVASACDGSAPDPCPDTDPGDGSSNTAGYSAKVAWTASSDTGSGVTGYKIYRRATDDSQQEEDFSVVGYLDVDPPGAPVSTVWYDNDTHNGETYTDTFNGESKSAKSSVTPTLNDHVTYYYRVTAIDDSENETDVITTTGVPPVTTFTNWSNATTLDVTDPSVPSNLTVTPVGIDSLGGDPLTQRMDISWGASTDLNNQSRTPNCVASGSGCSIKEYTLQQAQGDVNGPTEGYTTVYTGSGTSHTEEGLNEDTYYYYRVMSADKADNTSAYSSPSNAQTKNSQVPTSPTSVTVTAKTGDPNTDSEVGSKVTVTFNGSRITGTDNRVDGYRVYRSTTNLATEAEWLALAPVQTYENLNIPTDTQDGQRSFDDTVPDDATSYYYKVIADGWNNSNSEVVTSSLSAVSPDTLNQGWDTTPDATKPTSPLEVTVKDIHGDGSSMVRNIITWQRLDVTLAGNLRDGASDFAEYRVYRYTPSTVDSPELIVTYTNLADNYYVDGIPLAEANDDYYYYVVAVDNADTHYKYASPNADTIINGAANISDHLDAVSINPSIAKPTVSNVESINVGVSSATIEWDTDQSCDSLVEYRTKDSDTVKAAGGDRTSPVTDHQVGLVGLKKGETYEYRVVSRNSLGNIDEAAANEWKEFATVDFSIEEDPVETTTTTATISWTTNIKSDSSVEYKQEAELGAIQESQTAGDPKLEKKHEVVIKALKPDTNYTYKIRSVSEDKYISETNFLTFRTKPYDADQFTINPSASNIAEENITATSAKIVWNTAIATNTWVDYGLESEVYSQSAGDEAFNTVHVVELKNLTPGTTYFYRVRGDDVNGVEYTSREYSFTAVLKPQVSNVGVSVVDSYTVKVSFTTNVSTETAVAYGADGATNLRAGSAELVKFHEVTLENLEDATTYSYYVEVKDALGNTAKTATSTFQTPLDKTGAKVENLKIDILPMGESDETASTIISWNTNKPTTTKVEYDEGVISTNLGQSTIEDESLNTSHTVIIKELVPSATYKFRIAGEDKRGNKTESQDYTFVTPAKEKSIWQLIVRSIEDTFSWVSNVGSFFRGRQ